MVYSRLDFRFGFMYMLVPATLHVSCGLHQNSANTCIWRHCLWSPCVAPLLGECGSRYCAWHAMNITTIYGASNAKLFQYGHVHSHSTCVGDRIERVRIIWFYKFYERFYCVTLWRRGSPKQYRRDYRTTNHPMGGKWSENGHIVCCSMRSHKECHHQHCRVQALN
jgi:hypothetical protein